MINYVIFASSMFLNDDRGKQSEHMLSVEIMLFPQGTNVFDCQTMYLLSAPSWISIKNASKLQNFKEMVWSHVWHLAHLGNVNLSVSHIHELFISDTEMSKLQVVEKA